MSDEARRPENGNLFRGLMAYYIHQNQLMWSRVQLLVAIQVGVLGGAYSLKDAKVIAISMPILGMLLTTLLLFMMLRDKQIRDGNVTLLRSVGDKLAKDFNSDQLFELRPEPKGRVLFHATAITEFAFYLFIVLDLAVVILLISDFFPDQLVSPTIEVPKNKASTN